MKHMILENYYIAQFHGFIKLGYFIPPVTESNFILFIADQGIFYVTFLLLFLFIIYNYIFSNWQYLEDDGKLISIYFLIITIGSFGEDIAYEWFYWLFFGLTLGVYLRLKKIEKKN